MLKSDISRIVTELIEAFEITVPVDLGEIAKKLRIHVSEKNLDSEGYFLEHNGRQYIFLNSKAVSEERKRFTFAHEIGHALIHSNSPFLRMNAEREKVFRYYRELSDIESEANFFASELLLPSDLLSNMLPNSSLTFSDIKKISDKAHVSILSAAIKCVDNSKTENELLIFFDEFDELKWFCSANKYWTYSQMPPSFDKVTGFIEDFFNRDSLYENYEINNYGRITLISGTLIDDF